MSNTKDRGDETEAKVIALFLEHGYSVSVPFGDNDKYDLIVDDGGELYRVQCKTAWKISSRSIRFNVHSKTTSDGEHDEVAYHGLIDVFVVRYPGNESFYWVDVEDTPMRRMDLRFKSEIPHPAINWAEEYEFTGVIPE